MRLRLSTLLLLGAAWLPRQAWGGARAKNFIFVIPDGFGPASQTLARDFENSLREELPSRPLAADALAIGSVRTRSADNVITDSAAGGTAYACGIKTRNGAIAVDVEDRPVASILEAAHLAGLKTGLVVTSRLTDATPASFSAHVADRDSEEEIAAQQIGYSHPLGSVLDLLMGGGREYYLPKAAGGSRSDSINLVDWAKSHNYTYAADKAGLDAAAAANGTLPLPFLGLFHSEHLPFDIDRDSASEPGLVDMAQAALSSLEKASSESGYLILIEASRIDHAAHLNDAASHVHEVLAYNKLMAYLATYVKAHPDTQLLSAADHECGGLTLADGYNPAALAEVQDSSELLAARLSEYSGTDRAAFLRNDILPVHGLAAVADPLLQGVVSTWSRKGAKAAVKVMAGALASEAGIHWSTMSHTAVDVTLYGLANGSQHEEMKRLIGANQENTALPSYIELVLGLNLTRATAALRQAGTSAGRTAVPWSA